jgi:exodeoxyribonuclease V beta subunit
MMNFDPWKLQLGGPILIEASAGTGKTYTLTTLYIRLLVEENLLPSEILVVTYTHAATAELRERVRGRIREAIAAGEAPSEDRDPELRKLALAAREQSEKSGRPDPLRRALQEFDEAAIFTIHGFCQRTLQENAFESGVAFDAELVEKSDEIERTLAHDLWARILEGEDPGFVEWLRLGAGKRWYFEPDALARNLLSKLGADEEMPVLPVRTGHTDGSVAAGEGDLAATRREAEEVWIRWARAWCDRREIVSTLLLGENDLNKSSYKPKTIESTWLPQMDAWAAHISESGHAESMNAVELPKWWKNLTPEVLAKRLKKNGRAVEDDFFLVCGEVESCIESLDGRRRARALSLRQRFVEEARKEARRRREERHMLFFDDLLSELRAALRPPDGDRLAEQLRTRYRFALIDEFQDTDAVQYEIFRRVWHVESGDASRRGLILIGDPKQAIYSFRGADVFTYLAAHEDTEGETHGLGVNWRSNSGLIAAVNSLFGRPEKAFDLAAIEFNPVSAREHDDPVLSVPSRSEVGFRVLMADRRAAGEFLGETVANELPLRVGRTDIMRAFARDVADLLDAGAEIDGRPIGPSDIAVLCRRNSELARARRALEALGIPCVDRGDADVFESREAWELASIMRAMLRSGDPGILRGALSTGAQGFDANAILDLTEDAPELASFGERFAEYGRIWSQSGFGRAFAAWRRHEGVTERLLGFQDGERRLTNWLHLAELLQRIETDRSASRLGLIAWLERAIETPAVRSEVGSEASLLRLERDDQAVSLVTLHRSKGLEYEIVYLPSLWEDPASRAPTAESAEDESKARPPIRYFDEHSRLRTLDLGGPDYPAHAERAERETLSEQLRLLYVGLTRAKRQCVVVWGAIGRAYSKTPLAWLLHAPECQAEGKDRASSPAALKKWTDDEWRNAWQAVSDKAGEGAISVETVNLEARKRWQAPQVDRAPLAFGAPCRILGHPVVTTSFSALVRNGHPSAEPLSGPLVTGRDRDANVSSGESGGESGGERGGDRGGERRGEPSEIDETPDLAAAMHEFPRGAEAGTLLHEVLEQIDFSAYGEAELRDLATQTLERNGLEPDHADQIIHVVESVARTPLPSESGFIRLADVARGQLRPEIEFTLAAPGRSRDESFAPATLSTILSTAPEGSPLQCYAERVSRMGWRELDGYLRGFIDAVFFDGQRYFLIDYKSNHLGSQQADYRPDELLQPMIEHDYVLQYLIYAIALDRHLAQRLVGYEYDVHFGGVYYLFLRGLAPSHESGCGVFFDRPSAELIHRASALLGDPQMSKGAV